MPCAKPLTAYRPANGGSLSFNRPHNGQAGIDYHKIQLPCGQCILCRLEHSRQWAVRITHEARLHERSAFVTLTYADEHLPKHNSLNYAHLQKFWKRLRHHLGPLRYFAVGEYGDTTLRPHYHACIFGHDWTDGRTLVRTSPTQLWTHPELEAAWGLGMVSVGALTFQSAQYTAAYVTKKLNGKQQYVRVDEETGELVALVQPRAFMSRRPGLAAPWLDEFGQAIVDHDRVVIDGRAQKPPRYYDGWLKLKHPEREEGRKEKRRERAKALSEAQLRARAENAHARRRLQTKSI